MDFIPFVFQVSMKTKNIELPIQLFQNTVPWKFVQCFIAYPEQTFKHVLSVTLGDLIGLNFIELPFGFHESNMTVFIKLKFFNSKKTVLLNKKWRGTIDICSVLNMLSKSRALQHMKRKGMCD